MKKKLTHIILFLCVAYASVNGQTRYVFPAMNLFEEIQIVPTDSISLIYNLPDSFIITGSDSLWFENGEKLSKEDYTLLPVPGKLVFRRSLPENQILYIAYHHLPIQLPLSFFHQQPVALPGKNSAVSQKDTLRQLFKIVEPDSQKYEFSDLRRSGSILRAVSVGTNQGMKVESGLRLQLAGRVADKVDVVAALNDQNTPIQPEGNSQTLQEIDKIFVEIKGKQFAATLGDYVFNLDTGEYGHYSRKLQGAMGTVRWRDTSVRFSAALSRGQFHTNKLAGIEGNQGPYQLRGAKGEANIIVIAGTERVWLDGEKLTRGENNDYVIEYGNGQLSFTAKRLITENSRIVVDFQYSGENYKREFFGGEVQSSFWQQRLKFSANFIHENDDKENPLAFTLTPENEAELQGAGDALDSTYISGAVLVGENKGAYVQRDSVGVVFYQYAGENEGNYRVSFTYVGFGNGDYQQQGFNKYHYVGPNAGSYQSRVQLEPAQSHSLADFNLTFSPGKVLQISSELALSRRDENTFSTMDDENNDGFAWRLNFELKPESFQKLGKVDLSGQFKYVNNDFSAIDRTTAAEYDRHWDLGELALVQEKVWELKGAYQPWQYFTLSGQVGDNQKGDFFSASRHLWRLNLEQPAWPKLSVQNETIESDERLAHRQGSWDRRNAELSYDFWKLRPYIKYSDEQKKSLFADSLLNTGIQFDSYAGGLVFSPAEKISVSVQLIHRKDDDFILQSFVPLTDAWTQQYLLEVARWKYVSSSVNFTHREIDYLTSGEHKQTDLAEWRLNFNLLKRSLKGSGQYQLANTQVATQERQYLEVENGSGNYRYDSDLHEYVPDAFGDYIVRVVPTRNFLPVTQIKASLNYSFDARRLIKLEDNPRTKKLTPDSTQNMVLDKVLSRSRNKQWIQTFGRQFSCDGLMRLEEKTRDTDLWQVYRMNPGHLQTDSTLLGTVFLRQTAHWGKNNPLIYVRLNFQQERTLNRQYVAGGENMLKIIRSLRMTSSPRNKLNLQLEMLSRRDRRRFDYAGRSSRNIRSREGNAEFSYRLLKSFDLRLNCRYSDDVDQEPASPTTARLISLMPEANYAFSGKGRISLKYEWSQVTANQAVLPYEMVHGNAVGQNQRWQMNINYRLAKNIQGTVRYQGRRDRFYPNTIHIGQVEVKAFF